MPGCRHGPLQHYCWWNKHVANPIKKWGYVGKGRKAMMLLKHEILTKILLRRTKVQCADVLALPPRHAPRHAPFKQLPALQQAPVLCMQQPAWHLATSLCLWATALGKVEQAAPSAP